jgi:HPt (histidine-containing phosphotransfer) domain-containing protein
LVKIVDRIEWIQEIWLLPRSFMALQRICRRVRLSGKVQAVEHSSAIRAQAQGVIDDLIPLDAGLLSQSTFGDDELRGEIISLFQKQLGLARAQIAGAATASDWRFVMHTLKGASAAVGALQFAWLAQHWEMSVFPTESERTTVLSDFDRAESAFARAVEKF